MTLTLLKRLLFITLTCSSGIAQAAPSQNILYNYWGLSYQSLFIGTPGISGSAPSTYALTLGHHLDNSLAAEIAISLPSSFQTVRWNGQMIGQKVNTVLTGRLRKGLFNLNGFEGYGLLGLTFVSLDYSDNSSSLTQASKVTTDISYGIGTRFQLGNNSHLTGNIEYSQFLMATNLLVSSMNFGINYYY